MDDKSDPPRSHEPLSIEALDRMVDAEGVRAKRAARRENRKVKAAAKATEGIPALPKEPQHIRCYAYGLLSPRPRTSEHRQGWDDDCHQELRKQQRLWNALVSIHQAERAEYLQLLSSNTEVAALEAQLQECENRRELLITARRGLRRAARKRAPTPELDAQIAAVRSEILPLAILLKEARARARTMLKEELNAINDRHEDRKLILRNNSALWWSNYNAVCASYEVAHARAKKTGDRLRFRSFRGEGRFTCQIQQQPTTVADIFADKCTVVKMTAIPDHVFDTQLHGRNERRRLTRSQLSITVYTEEKFRRWLTFPCVYHRPLPPQARIKQVVVTRRKLATHYCYRAIFTLSSPAVAIAPQASGSCGINMGFRLRKVTDAQGRSSEVLRVATVAFEDGSFEYLDLPQEWLRRMDRVEHLQALRAQDLNAVIERFRESLKLEKLPEELDTWARSLVRAPRCATGRLAAFVLRWRADYPDTQSEVLEALERWQVRDHIRYREEANLREHLRMRRREWYRLFAFNITRRRASLIGLGKLSLNDDIVPVVQADGEENDLPKPARANRARAALFSLKQELANQAAKRGAIIREIDGPITCTCYECGGRTSINVSDVMQTCDVCYAVFDQDENAASNTLELAKALSEGAE
jgi:hypothetical protein